MRLRKRGHLLSKQIRACHNGGDDENVLEQSKADVIAACSAEVAMECERAFVVVIRLHMTMIVTIELGDLKRQSKRQLSAATVL